VPRVAVNVQRKDPYKGLGWRRGLFGDLERPKEFCFGCFALEHRSARELREHKFVALEVVRACVRAAAEAAASAAAEAAAATDLRLLQQPLPPLLCGECEEPACRNCVECKDNYCEKDFVDFHAKYACAMWRAACMRGRNAVRSLQGQPRGSLVDPVPAWTAGVRGV
jgi:hypothetical protein